MKKTRRAVCALCLALLIPLAVCAARFLPPDTKPLVAEKYAGWSGVLRLWVCEGWAEGSAGLTAWLNRCAARFEKQHPGVYVQPRVVDAGAIAAMNDSGIPRPDLLLVPPGVLTSPKGLMPLDAPKRLRAPLARCGLWGEALYAVPVALGGYLWAYDAEQLDRIPDTWRAVDATLAAPPAETWRRWDAALLALCAGQYADGPSPLPGGDALPLPGMDLGLADRATPAPTATPAPARDTLLPCLLPEGFQFESEAFRSFINGEAAATPVTQREARRLQALSEQGRGPDWRLAPGSGAFTDLVLCLAVADAPKGDARQALCLEFMDALLDDAAQGELDRMPAFSVTDAGSGYAAADPLATLDAALRDPGLGVPNLFDGTWHEACERIVRKFTDESGEAWRLWPCLWERLSENPNIDRANAPQS